MSLKLSLFYALGSDDQVQAACAAATAVLAQSGFTVEEAISAVIAAADLPDTYTETVTPNAAAVVAWWAAEHAAFQELAAQTGEWPMQASLIVEETT